VKDTMIPFKERLKHTIAQLKQETADGLEDWTPTIQRLEEVVKEEEEKQNET
jgi:hypothetical protein